MDPMNPTAADIKAAKIIFARLGGLSKSPKRAAASRKNGRKSPGAPRVYPKGTTAAQRYHLRNLAAGKAKVTTPAQLKAVTDVARLSAKEKK